MLTFPQVKFGKSQHEFFMLLTIFEGTVFDIFRVVLTELQLKIAAEVLFRAMQRRRHTIVIDLCRQVGKTEVVCYLVWFLSYIFPVIESERFKCVITAPEEGTGSEVFDRTKRLFDMCEARFPDQFFFEQKNLDVIILPNGSRLEAFGLFKNYAFRQDKKTTKEGRTYHVAIRDEMHIGDDEIFKDEIEPALSTTGGVDIWIGNGGYRECRAKQLVETTADPTVTVFKYDFSFMRDEMMREYERTKNAMFLRWVESQEKYITDNGSTDDAVRKNLFLEWMVTIGNFFAWDQLITHRRESDPDKWQTNLCDGGLDLAKQSDETVLTLTDFARNVREWAIFHGEYPDQVDQIALYLEQARTLRGLQVQNLYVDKTGVGDPIVAMLKNRIRRPVVHGIVFTGMNKDKLAKKAIRAFSSRTPFLTYPMNHPHRVKFEGQMKVLQKEHTGATGMIAYHHPKEGDAHDDFCFAAGMRILTREGWKNIENIDIGEEVMTREGYRRVSRSGCTGEREVIERFGIRATPNHPVITKTGIVRFDMINESDIIYIWNERRSCIEENGIIAIQASHTGTCASTENTIERVYNLKVEGKHEYIVEGMLVHNCDSLFLSLWNMEKLDQERRRENALGL